MSDSDSPRMVHCVKLDQDLPGLEQAPFPTQFGQFIFEKVSKQAWDLWLAESVRYINTYRVDLSSREGTDFMLEQLRIWLGVEEGELAATAWVPPKS
ncbi:MAG: oxidative damage protection protein [Deltaproteobacteria bacterium]|nr:oxidative damage protection protein [Deltaproteobacteria bacterium]